MQNGGTLPEETGTGSVINKEEEIEENIEEQQEIEIVTNLYFYEKNHLGTPIALSDKNGIIVEEYETDEFGNIQEGEESELNTIFFTGKIFNKETGLYFYNARYYSPNLGRFISRDPIGIVDDINLYAYVGNNPLKFVDPSGLNSKGVINKGISGGAVLGTFIGMGAAGIFSEDIYYGAEFLGYSLIGTTHLGYYEGSKYVDKLKETEDYKRLLLQIKGNIDNGILESSGSMSSTQTFTSLTLGKYNYEYSADLLDDYYDINITISDIYDFNKEKQDGSIMNWYLNKMHDANTYGILTPIDVKINTKETYIGK